jgi:thiosulfate/3-mercaptopyruvate sulfurtransferase
MSLISVEELHRRLGDGAPRVRVADVRWYLNREGDGRRAYDAGHIPGAIFLDLTDDLSAPTGAGRHPLPEPADFCRLLGDLGIGDDDLVVAYDDTGGTSAARLWWMLDNLGHRQAAVLDGGVQAWVAAGHGLETDEPDWPPAELHLADRWTNTIDRSDLADRLGTVTLLDARAPERYRGEVEPIDPAAGHIPTAINAPTAGNLDAGGRFLDAEQLRARFTAHHNPAMPVVTSCGSGTTACHNALAMRLAGLPEPILYVGSFSDWSRSGMPVATGAEPGRAGEPGEPTTEGDPR